MELFLTIVMTHFIALLTPGADFFLILKTLVQHKQKAARFTCLGIALGNAIILAGIYSSLFMIGQINTDVLVYMKWFGILYFAYLAFHCFKVAYLGTFNTDVLYQEHQEKDKQFYWENLLMGVCSSLLNPKNLLFYSMLIILIYSEYNLFQNVLLCCWMVSLVLFWNLALVRLFCLGSYLSWLSQYIHYLYYIAGTSFLFFMLILIIT